MHHRDLTEKLLSPKHTTTASTPANYTTLGPTEVHEHIHEKLEKNPVRKHNRTTRMEQSAVLVLVLGPFLNYPQSIYAKC